jgi:hypothetical protein
MKWFLEEKYPKANEEIRYGDGVIFIGSCFSKNIYDKGKRLGLNFRSTNHGTIFHPIPIARILLDAIQLNSENRILENEGKFYSWDASSKLLDESEINLNNQINHHRKDLHANLKRAKYLFLTFGTAKAYTNSEGLLVANCHKIPSSNFKSELSSLEDLKKVYKELIEELNVFNPELQVVMTVSPVRHSKDGLIENNRSKARLLLLCEQLETKVNTHYFPAYELIIDQLRDYRFYGSDLVHPTEEAINFVWEIFCETYFSEETNEISKQVGKIRSYFEHRILGTENERELAIRLNKENNLKTFLANHSQVIWE